MIPLLFALVAKLLSLLATKYIFRWLCTDYLDALVEFTQAYITVTDLVRNNQNNQNRRRPL